MSNIFWFAVLTSYLINVLATPLDPVPAGQGWAVSELVRYWEGAQYDRRPLQRLQHRRARRTPHHPHPHPHSNINISFKAHNREFHLRLRAEPNSIFADGVEFHSTRGQLDFDTGKVYTGTLEDDESSHVYGILTKDGLFDGTISTPVEDYYVEPLIRYGKTHTKIHSIIYKESDVVHPMKNSSSSCASHSLHLARQNDHKDLFKYHDFQKQGNNDVNSDVSVKVQQRRQKRWLPQDEVYSSTDDQDFALSDEAPKNNPEIPLDLDIPYTSHTEHPFIITQNNTRKPKAGIENLVFKNRGVLINTYNGDSTESPGNSRPKPKTHVEIIRTKSGVNLNKDNVNKKPIGFTFITSVGNQSDVDLRHVNKRALIDPKKTTCMLYLQADHMFYQKYGSEESSIEVMTRHVQKVNAIYKETDFNQDGKPDNITFMIKRIKVHTMDALQDPNYRFPGNYGVEKFLELFSEEDYDAFCLAYMFTYRDFEMGTLGLAWTGDLKNAGGVCEKNGHYRGSLKSLNTGIVTLLNYGKHVPPAVSHVTLAHEIGHNFGSPHDPEICTPGGEDGNFIMFARATSGDKKNNNHFSPCSLKSIDPVLNSKARSAKGCFTEPQPSICGNGVVEPGEQCDCGWEDECRDECCHPQRRKPAPHQTPCTLTPASACSPSQGPCCSSQCALRFGSQCRSDNGCRAAAYCDGRRASCPASIHKPNRTRCHAEFVCYMGECTGSICLAYGLESCQCIPIPGDPPTKACELCCKMPGDGTCRSSYQWNVPPYDVPDMYAKPGTPCNDYNGYCDVFQRCREVDPSGPLATLRNLLLSEESIASFKKWILDHWYAVVLIVTAVIFLLVMSTRLLGKKSVGKLKSVTIIHSSTTETVRLPEHCPEGVIVHTAIRSKVPLKKKVALKSRVHHNKKAKTTGEQKKKNTSRTKTRESAPVNTDDVQKTIKEANASKQPNGTKGRKAFIIKQKSVFNKGKQKKEVIDYSAAQKKSATLTSAYQADALGKVQKWLMSSPQPAFIPKSKSTPAELTEIGQKPLAKTSPLKAANTTRTSKSSNNLTIGDKERAKLQVVYKPPFKFSVKLFKNDKTKVILEKNLQPNFDHSKKKLMARHTAPADIIRLTPNGKNSNNESNSSGSNRRQSKDMPTSEPVISRSASEHKVANLLPVGSKFGHKKSNSTSQTMGDSQQNLLLQDHLFNFANNDVHVYENMLVDHEEGGGVLSKTCSMPRQNTNPNHKIIYRQSSYTHLPRAQANNLSRHSTNGSITNLSHPNMQRSTSNLNRLHSREGSRNNLQGSFKSEQNSDYSNNHSSKMNIVPNKRYSLDHTGNKGKTFRENSFIERPKSNKNIIMDSIHNVQQIRRPSLNKGNLKRQLSANDMYKGACHRPEIEMPQSAGTNTADFQWSTKLKKNSDCEVPKKVNAINYQLPSKGDFYQTVPNSQNDLVSSGYRFNHLPNRVNSSSKQLRNPSRSTDKEIKISEDPLGRKKPKTFGEMKDTLPNTEHCDSDIRFSDISVSKSEEIQTDLQENIQ